MNKLTALIEAAKEAEYGKVDFRIHPTFILELCALLEKCEKALEETTALCTNYEAVEEPDGYQFTEAPAVISQGNEALAAIKQWKEQT
jgi:hypothetical protein